MLPQRLAADHPGGRAEGIHQREQQRDRRLRPPPQQQVEERGGERRQKRGGELLHDSRHSIQARIRPTPQVQVTGGGKIERRDEQRQHHGVERDDVAVGPGHHPVRLSASPLRGDLRDRIEVDGVVPQDCEGQVARRVGVAGTDRPQVGVVNQQAAQPDQDARAQPVPVALLGLGMSGSRGRPAGGRGHGVMLIQLNSRANPTSLQGNGDKARDYNRVLSKQQYP